MTHRPPFVWPKRLTCVLVAACSLGGCGQSSATGDAPAPAGASGYAPTPLSARGRSATHLDNTATPQWAQGRSGQPSLVLPSTQEAPRRLAPYDSTALPTSTVVLAFLTSGNASVDLPPDTETAIFQNAVCAPCTPCFDAYDAPQSIQPVQGCPLPYTFWEVEYLGAPVSVQNIDCLPGILTVNVYSDNSYVYQQQMTVLPGMIMPVNTGAFALGYIRSGDNVYMPITLTMRAQGAHMTAILDTGAPASMREDSQYARVAGFGVHLLPMQ